MTATVRTAPPPARYPLPLPGWDGVVVTALVPPAAMSLLRSRRPGERVRLALAIADHEARPAYLGADRWRTDGQGRLDARGAFGRLPDEPLCVPGHLLVAGRRWPLDLGADVRPGTRLEVAGLLHVTVGAPSYQRTWTIRAWRRCVAAHPDSPAVVDLATDDREHA